MVRLGVVANGVAVGDQRAETHHAVCVRRHLKRGSGERKNSSRSMALRSIA